MTGVSHIVADADSTNGSCKPHLYSATPEEVSCPFQFDVPEEILRETVRETIDMLACELEPPMTTPRRFPNLGENIESVQWMDLQRQCHADEVILNVYDITRTLLMQSINKAFNSWGYGGAYHVGIEIDCSEFSYGFEPHGSGICKETPRHNKDNKFRGAIYLGRTQLSLKERNRALKGLVSSTIWHGCEYHPLTHNCVHFVETFASLLGVGPIPLFLSKLPELGRSIVSPVSSAWASMRRNLRAVKCTEQCDCETSQTVEEIRPGHLVESEPVISTQILGTAAKSPTELGYELSRLHDIADIDDSDSLAEV